MLSATVQWSPSGAAASSYTVTSSPRGITATVDGSSTSAVVTGLAFATRYNHGDGRWLVDERGRDRPGLCHEIHVHRSWHQLVWHWTVVGSV